MLTATVFMTRHSSLATWRRLGSLQRETALYAALRDKHDVQVRFVSWAGRKEAALAKSLGFPPALSNRLHLPVRYYERLMPMLHARHMKTTNVIKTNQMMGAHLALRAARFWNKPFIARCGYMWSEYAIADFGLNSPEAQDSLETESKAFEGADLIVVTTTRMAQAIKKRFPHVASRIRVVPNYVETERFHPTNTPLRNIAPKIGYIGRFAREKNLTALIEAVQDLEIPLDIVGKGNLENSLKKQAAMQPNVRFLGTIPNTDLPSFLQHCSLFAFPSLYEGHPKALIEAMACGLPVVTTNVPGISELIQHGRTGWLCEPDAVSLRRGVQHVLSHPDLAAEMGRNARQYVLDHFALDKIVKMEWEAYRLAIEHHHGRPK